MVIIVSEIINGIEYKEITVRGRTKLVSKYGDLINPRKRNQKATLHMNKDGYPCCGGGIPIHLYVAYGWVDGYFEGAEVNHKDYDRTNYIWTNLEWVTHKENINYSSFNTDHYSKSKNGEQNGRSVFTEQQVVEIRKMYDDGKSIADIIRFYYPKLNTVKKYKNIHSIVSSICRRKSWKNI